MDGKVYYNERSTLGKTGGASFAGALGLSFEALTCVMRFDGMSDAFIGLAAFTLRCIPPEHGAASDANPPTSFSE